MKKITLSFIALLILSTFLINCGGGSGGSSSPGGEKPGVPEIVQVLPSHYIAMTNSAILIRAKILNGNGGPVKNLPVTFTNISPIGTLMSINDALLGNKAVVRTNDSGMATIKVKSTTTGFVTIQAEVYKGVGIVRDRKTMYFSSSLSSSPFMYIDADADSDLTYNEPSDYTLFESNNASDNQVLMRATVYSKFGQRVFGSTVQFGADFPYKVGSSTTCSDGTSSCSVTFPNGNSATTNSSGEAFVLVKVDPVVRNITTILNITAVADNGAANVYSLFLEPIIISSVTVTANPSIVAPAGESTISAAVRLNTGGPPPDDSAVGFVADCGTVTPFALTTTGLATATFTAPSVVPSPPVCRVTATIDGVSNFADITISSALNVQPGTQTLNGLSGGTVSYIISGGVAPYTVTSTNRFAACNSTDSDCSDAEDSGSWTVTASGGIFTVTVPANTAAQSITLTVRDLVGTTKDATLTIGSGGALSVQPGTVSINGDAGGDVIFTIFGGVPGYDVFPNNADPVFTPSPSSHVTSSGGTFKVTVPPGTAAKTIIYTVRDSAATTTTGTLTITSTAPPTPPSLAVLPGTVTVNGAAPADTVTFTIFGGTPPYNIFSNNVLYPPSVSLVNSSGGQFTATVPAGSAAATVAFTVRDTTGTTVAATLTITATAAGNPVILPGTVSVIGAAPADIIQFTVTGGIAPYVITSTDPASVYDSAIGEGIWNVAASGGTFNANIPATATTGDVTLNLFDFTGTTSSATVTITGGSTPGAGALSLTPSSVSVSGEAGATDAVLFTITGGTSPYSMVSNNTAVIPNVAVVGSSFTIDPEVVAASTGVTITVIDNVGATDTSTVTITPATSSMAVNPSTIAVTAGTTITFNIIGGVASYSIYSSDTAVVGLAANPVITSSTIFSTTLTAAGTATIAIVDSDNKTVTASVTVNP